MTHGQLASTQELTAAFEQFNRMSDSLGESYKELEDKVSLLSDQLAAERSEKLRQLAAKEQLANRLSALLSVLPGGVLVLDGAERIEEANTQARSLFGHTLVGQYWQDVLTANAVEGEDLAGQSLTLRDGKRIWLSHRILDDETTQVLLVADVTDAYRWQETVNRERRLAALGEMAARLAHQLRTPLSAALLYLSHLGIGEIETGKRQRLCTNISDRLRHIEDLVDGMLAFVRGTRRNETEFLLSQLVDDAKQTITPALEAKQGELVVDINEDLQLRGCQEDLLTILITLAENAIERTDRPRLELTVKVNGQWIDITIKDNGPGIPESVREKIFDPFFTTRANGTGLGLSTANAIAKEHGGGIELVHTDDNGTEFLTRIARRSCSIAGMSYGDDELMESVKW